MGLFAVLEHGDPDLQLDNFYNIWYLFCAFKNYLFQLEFF